MPGKIKTLIAAALLAAPAGAWLWPGRGVPLEEERRPASLPAGESEASELGFEPRVGLVYGYRFHREIRISGLDNALPPIEFSGVLNLRILEVDSRGFDALVTDLVEGQPATKAVLKIHATRAGDRLAVFSSRQEDEAEMQHVAVMKDLLSQLFFPLRTDTTGAYEARFETIAPEAGYLRMRKVKVAYSPPAAVQLLSSRHWLRWDSRLHMPFEVSGEEEGRLGGGKILSRGSYRMRLEKAVGGEKISPDLVAALSREEALTLSPTKLSLRDHPDYAHLDWGETLAKLRRASGLSSSEQLQLFGDLVKLLEMHPGKVGDLLSLLRSEKAVAQGTKSTTFQQVVGALATNGSPEAQAALVEIYQDPNLPVDGKGSILSALTTTQAARGAPTREFLANVMNTEENKDLAFGAAFALGSSLASAPDDDQAKDSIQRILAAWNAAASASLEERLAWLDVMGNSGRLEFFPAVSSTLQTGMEPALRARGAFSLRFMSSSSARSLLAGSLGDPDASVRSGAAYAIQMATWNEAFRQSVSTCSLNELDNQIRKICLDVHNRHSAVAQSD